jgi:hypothetical protein
MVLLLQQLTQKLWNGTVGQLKLIWEQQEDIQLVVERYHFALGAGGEYNYRFSSNRRMDRRRSPVNSNHNNFIIYNDDKL